MSRPVKKVCPNCKRWIRTTSGKLKNPNFKCPHCRKLVNPQAQQQVVQQPQAAQQPQGSFRQTGVLCLFCMNNSPVGIKKCQSCRKKLKIKPSTMIYFNGQIEAIQCQKCGGYTNYRDIKCQKCKKKIKF